MKFHKFAWCLLLIVAASAFFAQSTVDQSVPASKKSSMGGGLRGVREFFQSGTFTVPSGVTHVMVTMWGAGGGGGAGNDGAACQIGGPGGGSAYTNTVVPVIAGSTYTVTVGSGGTGGVNAGDNGNAGGDSQFALGDTVVTFAGGGQGGTGATTSAFGTFGSGGQADGTAQISHSGPNNTSSAYAVNLSPFPNATNQQNVLGTGGGGGFGILCGASSVSGRNGTSGYVLLAF